VRFALSLPNMGPPQRLVEIAQSADRNGWDAVFLWDHVHFVRSLRRDVHDPWVVLGAIATTTERIRVGTLVTPLPRRRPHKVAKEVVTLDHLSGGRATLGVGLGFPPDDEFEAFGDDADARRRGDRLDEALTVITALWTGEPVDHAGEHYRVSAELRPAPVQQPRPPIWVAGFWPAPRPLQRAMRYDAYVPLSPTGEPLSLDDLRAAADAVAGRCDIVAGWMPDHTVGEYDDAGATWLTESRWPVDGWMDELAAVAAEDPRSRA
jgi:alkanesulfonate monooxygenase SsuD/methylene tetrahydromethanopterin reductase-like flavin-dependent oxidoreductase (luciferase family)